MPTVLILEDEDPIRRFLAASLEWEGHETITYPDAAPALDEVDFDTVDLIITDIGMPTDGRLAIQAMRTIGVTAPIIAMSGGLKPGDDKHLLSLGAQCVLPKPFELDMLLAVMHRLLGVSEHSRSQKDCSLVQIDYEI